MANFYPVGQLVRITGVFTNSTGGYVDPTSVQLTIEVVDGSTDIVLSTTSLTHPSTGTYYYDYNASSTGLTEYRWESVNPQAVDESYFVISASRIT